MKTQYFEIANGHHGLMRVQSDPDYLDLAAWNGTEYVTDGDLLRFYRGEDKGRAEPISADRARELEGILARRRP